MVLLQAVLRFFGLQRLWLQQYACATYSTGRYCSELL